MKTPPNIALLWDYNYDLLHREQAGICQNIPSFTRSNHSGTSPPQVNESSGSQPVKYRHEETAGNISRFCIPLILANLLRGGKECRGSARHQEDPERAGTRGDMEKT